MESRNNSSGSEGFVLHGSSSHHPFLGTTCTVRGGWNWEEIRPVEPVIKSLVTEFCYRKIVNYYLSHTRIPNTPLVFEEFHGVKRPHILVFFCFSLLSFSFFFGKKSHAGVCIKVCVCCLHQSQFFRNKTLLTRVTRLGSRKLNQQI